MIKVLLAHIQPHDFIQCPLVDHKLMDQHTRGVQNVLWPDYVCLINDSNLNGWWIIYKTEFAILRNVKLMSLEIISLGSSTKLTTTQRRSQSSLQPFDPWDVIRINFWIKGLYVITLRHHSQSRNTASRSIIIQSHTTEEDNRRVVETVQIFSLNNFFNFNFQWKWSLWKMSSYFMSLCFTWIPLNSCCGCVMARRCCTVGMSAARRTVETAGRLCWVSRWRHVTASAGAWLELAGAPQNDTINEKIIKDL